MEKRLIAAIILTVVFLFLYTTLVHPPDEHPEDTPAPQAPRAEAPAPRPEAPEAPPRPVFPLEESEYATVETDLYRVVFSPAGARIKSFRLKNFAERWKPAEEIEREISGLSARISKTTSEIVKIRTRMRGETGAERLASLEDREIALKAEEEALRRSKRILECLKEQTAARKEKISALEIELERADEPAAGKEIRERIRAESGVELIPPEAVCFDALPPSVSFPGLNAAMDLLLFKTDKTYLRVTEDDYSLRFTSILNDEACIEKVFSFSNDSYVVGMEFSILNKSGRTLTEPGMKITYSPGVGLVESAPARGVVTGIVSFVDGAVYTDKIAAGRSALDPGIPKLRTGNNVWTAIKGKYFTAALLPEFERCVLSASLMADGGREIGLHHPEITVESGAVFSTGITMYLGPQDADELSKADETLKKIIDYGFWSPIAKVIDYLLKVFNGVFNNFGIAIIMLSLTVKVVFYPLTRKSFIAMKKMQDDMKAIQPKINELKKKYGNNQQKLNKATMELYKKEGVNPMSGCKGGCFPMLLQMPVFFALYAVLNTSIELRGAHFTGWITDLSMPDPLRILPVLMGISMFWQQKQTGGAAGGGAQQEQAKMMQWMMPVMLTFIFFGLPSGIVLYWFSFNIFTSIQQMLIRKHGA